MIIWGPEFVFDFISSHLSSKYDLGFYNMNIFLFIVGFCDIKLNIFGLLTIDHTEKGHFKLQLEPCKIVKHISTV